MTDDEFLEAVQNGEDPWGMGSGGEMSEGQLEYERDMMTQPDIDWADVSSRENSDEWETLFDADDDFPY